MARPGKPILHDLRPLNRDGQSRPISTKIEARKVAGQVTI